jgi:hypothetical protein
MTTEGKDPQRQDRPERVEPDLTPAPGTQPANASGGDELGFDQDSPDLGDPQVDPTHPATPPAGPVDDSDKRAKGESYPPYDGKTL